MTNEMKLTVDGLELPFFHSFGEAPVYDVLKEYSGARSSLFVNYGRIRNDMSLEEKLIKAEEWLRDIPSIASVDRFVPSSLAPWVRDDSFHASDCMLRAHSYRYQATDSPRGLVETSHSDRTIDHDRRC